MACTSRDSTDGSYTPPTTTAHIPRADLEELTELCGTRKIQGIKLIRLRYRDENGEPLGLAESKDIADILYSIVDPRIRYS